MDFFEHGGHGKIEGIFYDFSSNINPLGIPEGVKEVLKTQWKEWEQYPDSDCRELREHIAMDRGTAMEWVICGNGASELIYALVRAWDPSTAILLAPSFSEYERALQAQGCGIIYYPLKRGEGFQLTEEFLTFLDGQDKAELLFICNPNNPVGNCTDRFLLERIVKKCQEKGILLAVDECFLPFARDWEQRSLISLCVRYQNLFLLSAFTKLYAIPGLRLGYGISSHPKLLEAMRFQMPSWNVSGIAQAAGIAALAEKEYVKQSRHALWKQQEIMTRQLEKMPGRIRKVYQPEANFIFFEARPGLDTILWQQGIAIRNCENYRGLAKGDYRIAVRGESENAHLMKALHSLVPGGGGIWQRI